MDPQVDQRSNDIADRAEVGITKSGIDFKGSTTQMLILLCCLLPVMALGIVLYFLYQHEENTKNRTLEGHAIAREFVGAINMMTASNKYIACIMSLPQDKRERDYMGENSFCKQMTRATDTRTAHNE